MDCPKCVGRLQKKTVNVKFYSDKKGSEPKSISKDLELDQCFSCGGVWFDQGELDQYMSDQLFDINSPLLGGDLDQKLDQKDGKCPKCEEIMTKKPAPTDSSITIDFCEKCSGVWLDSTEIDQLEKKYKGIKGSWQAFLKGIFRKKIT